MKRLILSPVVLLVAIMGTVTSNSISAQDLDAATSLTRSEQYDKSAEMFKQLIQKEPGNSRYFFSMGKILFRNILQILFQILLLLPQKRQKIYIIKVLVQIPTNL